MAESTALIQVTQLPIIEERLQEISSAWRQMTQDVAALACTNENLPEIRKKKAEMTKKFEQLEAQRKAVVARCMEPIKRFEQTYKDCIAAPYKAANATMRGKIKDTEDVVKDACEARLRDYFVELCEANGVEWLRYEQAGIKVDLTSAKQKAPRKLMNALSEFVIRVSAETETITRSENEPDVMAEYKRNGLNLARAELTVAERKEAAERERRAAEGRADAKKRQEEAIARVDEAAALQAPVEANEPEDPVFERFSFTCIGVRKSQLIRVRDYLKKEGINYE